MPDLSLVKLQMVCCVAVLCAGLFLLPPGTLAWVMENKSVALGLLVVFGYLLAIAIAKLNGYSVRTMTKAFVFGMPLVPLIIYLKTAYEWEKCEYRSASLRLLNCLSEVAVFGVIATYIVLCSVLFYIGNRFYRKRIERRSQSHK